MNDLRHELVSELEAGGSGRVYPEWKNGWDIKLGDGRRGEGEDSKSSQGGRSALKSIELISLRRSKVNEWFDGGVTLRQLVHRHLLVVGDFVKIARLLLEDLDEIHKAGGVHGDIQPCKVKFNNSLRSWICGVGLQESEFEAATGECKQHLVGSLCFMAPELYSGSEHDVQTDLYAMGCLFYYMLTGCVPFYGETAVELMIAHTVGVYVPLEKSRAYMDKDLTHWVEKLFYKERELRFSSCTEALDELDAFSELDDFEAFDITFGDEHVRHVAPVTSRSICAALGGREEALNRCALASDEVFTESRPSVAMMEKFFMEYSINPTSGKMGSCPRVPVRITEESLEVIDKDCWFAMVDDVDLGPMCLESLGGMILDGTLHAEDYIWRVGWSDWRRADECEDAGEFICAHRMLMEQAIDAELQKEEERVELCHGIFNCELLVSVLTAIAALLSIYAMPHRWETIMSTYALFVVFVGFVGLKAIEGTTGLRWLLAGLVLPGIADIYFVMKRKKYVLQSVALMAFGAMLVGAVHLNA